MRVFVSYRRDDAAGHAGRLADDLAERLDSATIFHDVESIGPGDDFVAAIQRAIDSADVVLVTIGSDWSTAADAAGRPRLFAPDDLVRLEVATALRLGKRVIPVLVGEAVMPDMASLPPDIAPIAHRNAVEVRPEAWDLDVDRLASALGGVAHATQPPAPASGPSRWTAAAVAAVCIAALVVGVVVWSPWAADDPDSSAADETSDGQDSGAGGSTSAGSLALPDVARTMLHSSGAALEVIVESGTIGVPEGKVALDLRIENRGGYDDFLAPSDIQLVADGQTLNPNQTDGYYLAARTTSELALDYDVSGDPADLVLLVHHWAQEGRIPLIGPSVASAELPAVATAPQTISVTAAEIVIGPAAIDELSDRFLVRVPIAITNTTPYAIPFFANAFRLQVDGASQAPVEFVNEVVEPDATQEATFVWGAPLDAGALVLTIDYQGETAEVALT